MPVKITRLAQTTTPQFSPRPKAFSWRLKLQLRPSKRKARFLPARLGLPPSSDFGETSRWQTQRDTAFARTSRAEICKPVARPKAPSPLCSAGAVQKCSAPFVWKREIIQHRKSTRDQPDPLRRERREAGLGILNSGNISRKAATSSLWGGRTNGFRCLNSAKAQALAICSRVGGRWLNSPSRSNSR
jgi:hypothetical protein